jgi:hypothetical protein
MLCSAGQRAFLGAEAERLGLEPYLDQPVNRKGLDTALCAWRKLKNVGLSPGEADE